MGSVILAVNAFAKAKAGDMLLAEKNFFRLALSGFENVAKEQISWIKKSPEDLVVVNSIYKEEKKELLIDELLKIEKLTLNELIEKKEQLSKKFRKDFFGEIVAKNGSFSNDKFATICSKFGLRLITETDAGKNMYTVIREEEA